MGLGPCGNTHICTLAMLLKHKRSRTKKKKKGFYRLFPRNQSGKVSLVTTEILARVQMEQPPCRDPTHRFFLCVFRHYFHAGFFGFREALRSARFQPLGPGRFRWRVCGSCRRAGPGRRRSALLDGRGQASQARWVKVVLRDERLVGRRNLHICFDVVAVVLGVNLPVARVTAECWFD